MVLTSSIYLTTSEMVGKNCFAISSDRRLGGQVQTVATDFQRIFKIHDKFFIGLSGLASDAQTLSQRLAFRHKLYELREERNMKPETFASLVSALQYGKRFGYFAYSVESQDIISSCWPGLTSLHLEECGEITANGVGSLLDCHALEDLRLRHTGAGIPKNFIIYAASKLPMLRKVSLDMCDAKEHDFDIPSFADRYFLRIVTIARCKPQKCSIGLHFLGTHKTPVHKESLLLVWNSKKLVRTVVKERL